MIPGSSQREDDDGPGLLGGVTAFHFRMLCENPWKGGLGYTPEQVSVMTLDQILFLLCDKDLLKNRVGKRVKKYASGEVPLKVQDGQAVMKAKSKDGKVITLKSTGKSKAKMITEQKEKERQQQRLKSGKKRKRRGT